MFYYNKNRVINVQKNEQKYVNIMICTGIVKHFGTGIKNLLLLVNRIPNKCDAQK